jgi:catalase
LGSHNFQELPINRPISPVNNNQRDGHMRHTINTGRVSYEPNTLGGGCPFQAKAAEGGFTSFPERVESIKIRERSKSFLDHFSQAILFYNSQSEAEKDHLTDALCFELGKVETFSIKERMVKLLTKVDKGLAARVAVYLGIKIPEDIGLLNRSFGADAKPEDFESKICRSSLEKSSALSMANTKKDSIKTRQIAFLVADGVDEKSVLTMMDSLTAQGAVVHLIAPKLGSIVSENDIELLILRSFLTTASVLYDAVYIPSGINSVATLAKDPDALHFIDEAFKHCKPIAFDTLAMQVMQETYCYKKLPNIFTDEYMAEAGISTSNNLEKLSNYFSNAIANHRFWDRGKHQNVPA